MGFNQWYGIAISDRNEEIEDRIEKGQIIREQITSMLNWIYLPNWVRLG